jgi:hypothetical protein
MDDAERYEQLGRLNDLRVKGALTEDEFAQAKARLLEDTGTPAPAPAPRPAPLYTMGRLAGSWDPKLRDECRARGIFFHSYPVWVMVLLTIITVGIYAEFWLNHWHGIMPKRRNDDPSTGRAIGFLFIPFFNLYWVFESLLRVSTRLDEELEAAGYRERVPKELVRWMLIINFVPYVGLVSGLILAPIAVGIYQSKVNQLAAYDQSRASEFPMTRPAW